MNRCLWLMAMAFSALLAVAAPTGAFAAATCDYVSCTCISGGKSWPMSACAECSGSCMQSTTTTTTSTRAVETTAPISTTPTTQTTVTPSTPSTTNPWSQPVNSDWLKNNFDWQNTMNFMRDYYGNPILPDIDELLAGLPDYALPVDPVTKKPFFGWTMRQGVDANGNPTVYFEEKQVPSIGEVEQLQHDHPVSDAGWKKWDEFFANLEGAWNKMNTPDSQTASFKDALTQAAKDTGISEEDAKNLLVQMACLQAFTPRQSSLQDDIDWADNKYNTLQQLLQQGY